MATAGLTIPPIVSEEETEFSMLFHAGIDLLQKYSGNTWTDFNEHDPGVTILEELCYAITELYSRTNLSVRDLLTRSNGLLPHQRESSFFSPASILFNNPLTPNDYRKLVVDAVYGISNAWIIPLPSEINKNGEIGISGMYKVMVDLEESPTGPEKQETAQHILKILNAHRNLCEEFSEVNFLEQQKISISCELHIENATMAEEILASLLLMMQDHIRPEIDFYTLPRMLEMGYAVEEIFEGPKLRNGFVTNDQLVDKKNEIAVAGLLKFAFSVPGIRNISNLVIIDESQETGVPQKNREVFFIGENAVAILDLDKSLDQIRIFSKGVTCHFNRSLVISKFSELKSKTWRSRKLELNPQQLDLPVHEGIYRNPGKYFSIQHDFPAIYGLKEPVDTGARTNLEKVQVLQLKAYLLFFEQLLADFLAQVENVNKLFSTAAQSKTYFYQSLRQVPGITPVLGDDNTYESGLKDLYRELDEVETRRKTVLKHLLSRFSLAPFVYTPTGIHQHYNMPDEVTISQNILKNAPLITEKRGAADIFPGDGKNVSGLEYMIHLTTGLNYKGHESKTAPAFRHIVIDEQNDKFIIGDHTITEEELYEVIQSGMQKRSYRIDQFAGVFTLFLVTGVKGYKLQVLDTPEESKAREVIEEWVSDFRAFHGVYEKFYLVDHILLKPANRYDAFVTGQQELESAANYARVISLAAARKTGDKLYVFDRAGKKISSEFYSNRISIVMPKMAANMRDKSFGVFLNYLLTMYSPAHINVNVVSLKAKEYADFVSAYPKFLDRDDAGIKSVTDILLGTEVYANLKHD